LLIAPWTIVTALAAMKMPETLPSLRIGAEADDMFAYKTPFLPRGLQLPWKIETLHPRS
jgi:hypothetical protein